MAGDEKAISLRPSQWHGEIAGFLALAFDYNNDPLFSLDDLENDVVCGRVQLVEVVAGDVALGAIALRLDRCAKGSEMVIVAAGGKGANLMASIMPSLEIIAAACGAQSVRVHSCRSGMGRALRGHGFFEAERVYRKGLGNDRRKN